MQVRSRTAASASTLLALFKIRRFALLALLLATMAVLFTNASPASAQAIAIGGTSYAPTNLSASAGNAQMTLTWSPSPNGFPPTPPSMAPLPDASYSSSRAYYIYRGTTAGGEGNTSLFQVPAPSGAGSVSYTDTSAANGTAYYYQVTAVSIVTASGTDPNTGQPFSRTVAQSESDRSNEATATPTAPATLVAPTDLAVYATGSGKVTLYWSGVANATGYNIYRGTAAGGEDYTHPVNGATPVTTKDTGPGVTNTFLYSDTNGLTNGTEYFYTVKAVNGSSQSAPSNEDSDVPNTNAVPWDTGNATSIVSAVNAIASASLPSDPEDPDSSPATVGPLFILSPDGVVYQGNFSDGSSAIATQAPGYYDPTTNERVYTDGTVTVAPRDVTDPNSSQSTTSSSGATPLASGIVTDKGLGALPPTGMTRQVATQPGATGFSGIAGLPNATDPTQVRLDAYHTGRIDPTTGKELVYPDGAEIYTGGHVFFPASVASAYPKQLGNDPGNIDAGLQLTTYPYPNTMWQPFVMPGIKMPGTEAGTKQRRLLGGVGGKEIIGDWKVFISGEIRMVFLTPMMAQVPSKSVMVGYQTPYNSNGTTIQVRHVISVDANNVPSYNKTLTPYGVTYFYSGTAAQLWLRKPYNPKNPTTGNNSFILKRTNVISQTLNPNSANGTHAYAPVANGPNNDINSGFRINSSYVLGAYWGDSDPYGVALYGLPSTSWTNDSSVTAIAGAFPGTPYGFDTRFIKSTLNNPFFWETNLNMKTFIGTLPGF